MDIRDRIIKASITHFESHIEKHAMNIEVMLANPIAIHDHTDIMSGIESELEQMAEYQDKLDLIKTYFL